MGWASDGELFLSEEERESHIHILGAPGTGKSKLLELLIRQDIDRGYGCCLIDPNRGDTVYSVLRYCAKIGHDKVLLIDPHDILARHQVCALNPFGRIHYTDKGPRYNTTPGEAVGNTMDTMRILWGDKGQEQGTAKINRYLPAVLKALHKSRSTLHDAVYFSVRNHVQYNERRTAIIESLHPLDKDRVGLEAVFSGSPTLFNMDFESTNRRLNPLLDDNLKLMLGSNNTPVNFMKMVSEGWVILVNVDPNRVWSDEQEKFLGTLVINELIFAVSRLIDSGVPVKPYYVYVDEAGKYATPKLAEILDYKRHIGIRFALAHQRFKQFGDEDVRSSVKGSTKIKVLFNAPDPKDRDEMVRMMYGGDIPDRQVSYELSLLPQRTAAIKINTQPPRVTRLPDVLPIDIPDTVLASYKDEIYKNEWYSSREEILDEINARFPSATGRSVRPQQPGDFGERRKSTRSGPKVAKRPAPSNDGADSKAGQPSTEGRPFKSAFSEEED